MIVRAIWEFDVDDSKMNEKFVDKKGLCEDLTKRELDYCLKHNQLNAEDFIYETHPELPSDWDNEKESEVDYMNETQEKIYGLLESYLEYCKTNGYTEFEVWCEDNIDTINEDTLVQDIYQEVNHIADKLFE